MLCSFFFKTTIENFSITYLISVLITGIISAGLILVLFRGGLALILAVIRLQLIQDLSLLLEAEGVLRLFPWRALG